MGTHIITGIDEETYQFIEKMAMAEKKSMGAIVEKVIDWYFQKKTKESH
ncbi:MAG TPA: hypothetical protein VJH22_01885 [Candidatus Nanoarchaeia archaeon]|nr:hypothetical protein [Candidatus Nanoarchaeia archaeon]